MQTNANKTQANQSQAVANELSQKQGNGEGMQFIDNRPEAVAQRKLQEMANNSAQVKQLKGYQEMADNSYGVNQLKVFQNQANVFADAGNKGITQLMMATGNVIQAQAPTPADFIAWVPGSAMAAITGAPDLMRWNNSSPPSFECQWNNAVTIQQQNFTLCAHIHPGESNLSYAAGGEWVMGGFWATGIRGSNIDAEVNTLRDKIVARMKHIYIGYSPKPKPGIADKFASLRR